MSKAKKSTIEVQGAAITILSQKEQDFICLTDIARFKNVDRFDDLIRNWLRNRNTVEFLGVWERLNNPSFNPVEFDGIRMQAGLNSFTLTPKQWIEKTRAIGIVSSAGRYGGTFAHKDIAFEFASWISVEFRLYLIKEFQRIDYEGEPAKVLRAEHIVAIASIVGQTKDKARIEQLLPLADLDKNYLENVLHRHNLKLPAL